MDCGNQIIVHIGHIYRIICKASPDGFYVLEALKDHGWEEVRCWDDPGHVANVMVRHGVAADHADALNMLGVPSCDAA